MFKKKHPWFRRRGYPHFDQPIGFDAARRIVTSPRQVEHHSFYPLIQFIAVAVKVKRIAGKGKLEKISKYRPIAYASHVDSHIYSYYAYQLSKQYEKKIVENGLQSCVIAFRALGKSNVDFAADAFKEIALRGDCHVICLDITGFFDNLEHKQLKSAWCTIIEEAKLPADHYAVFKSLTQHAKVKRDDLYQNLGLSIHNRNSSPRRLCAPDKFRDAVRGGKLIEKNIHQKGIPQGTPISALLSNIYMFHFDKEINNFVVSCGGTYFRYCDDMLLIVPTEKQKEALTFVETEIKKLSLEINKSKTDTINFALHGSAIKADKNLQYLGFLFNGERISLRSASLARYSDRMRRGIRLAKATMEKRNASRLARGESAKLLFKKKIYKRYTHFGRRNFISYGYKAAETLNSNSIRQQLARLWARVQGEISK